MPDTVEALLVALLAIVPGYLARAAWARNKTFTPPATDLTLVIQSIASSVVVQVLIAPITIHWILPVAGHLAGHPLRVTAWTVVTLTVGVIGGYAFGQLSNKFPTMRPKWLADALTPPLPTMWDIVHMEHLIPGLCLLVVEFVDGHRLAGAFAGQSKATTSPEKHGLFLEQEWGVGQDGLPTVPLPNSGGLLITNVADVRSVHVFVP